MKGLIIAGPRSGEWVDILDDARTYLDFRTADTYLVRPIVYVLADENNEATDMWRLPLVIHPQLAGHPQEREIAQGILNALVAEHFMADYMRLHGQPQDLGLGDPTEPIAVPDSPAELFHGENP